MNLRTSRVCIRSFLWLLLLALTACQFKGGLENRVVVRVNDATMTSAELAQQLAEEVRGYDGLTIKDQQTLSKVKERIIQNFIVRNLTKTWAKNNGIFVRKEDLDAEIEKVRKSYPDDFSFKNALAEEGMTFDQWRDRMADTVIDRLVHKKVTENAAPPTDADARTYYEEHKELYTKPEMVRLRQIVLKTEADASRMQDELKAGKKFADLASKYSTTPDGKTGGDMGWLPKGISENFDKGFLMRIGERSPIVKSEFGYHIFEVLDKKKAKVLTFEEARSSALQAMKEEKNKALYAGWLESQIKSAKVFRDDALINSLNVHTRSE